MLHPQKHAAQQNRLRTIPVLDARMLDTAGRAGQAGVVVNHVQLAEFFYGALDSRLDVGLGSDVGPLKDGARPPFSRQSRTAASAPSILRSATTTAAPSPAKRIAVPRPIPLAAPVTTATLPSSLPIFLTMPVRILSRKRENETYPNDGIIRLECPKCLA